ncbi:PREDICTED: probable amino acid permease 7 [Ipomoea nil]|uniref:probable amino acid permease 7 n=1 Tax=Ipomoea nil TaxID=35883 RepID=UPI0009010946|nr:PREDICTED: probable amino acid permease 7 [Ipomoea nil]
MKRTGNQWTAFAHIITAVIGSGVLSLAWSVAQLGWIAGPIILLCFASVTLTSAFLLCNCYKSTDQQGNMNITHSHGSYLEAVQSILGNRKAWICGIFVWINSIKLGIVYTITFALSISAIRKSNCYHDEGHKAECQLSNTIYMIIFGSVQVLLSQIPDFRSTKWLSIAAALMSFIYSSIGSGLSLAKVIDNGEIKGGIGGWPSPNAAKKVWPVAQALGNIAFAFPFSIIILEIQDTLKEPTEKATMKKASTMAVWTSTFFYLCCGGLGYAAFGTETPGNLLAGFGFYEPYWLLDFANACIAVQLCGGYQVFSQPFYAIIEKWLRKKLPQSRLFVGDYNLTLNKHLLAFRLSFLRVIFRTSYVAVITGIAILFPYFNQVVGFAGAITFWPIVVYFPVEMYLKQKKIESWTTKKIVLRTYTYVCLMVILFAFVGSIRALIIARFS